MLWRIQQLRRVGRFEKWDSAAARRDEARFRRLTLVYGRNASGKSTLSRVLHAAAQQSTSEMALDRTLSCDGTSEVTLELASGTCRFNGAEWTGPVPNVVVFDRSYVESNIYIGRKSSKDHRKELLRLALGPADVRDAKELDELNERGRGLRAKLAAQNAIIDAAAAASQLLVKAFISLPRVDALADAQSKAEATLGEIGKEIHKRARPSQLPDVPTLALQRIEAVLARDARAISGEIAAIVGTHLAKLGDGGEAWVREGLQHQSGDECPYCARALDGTRLVELYGEWFDRTYDAHIAQVNAELEAVVQFASWWRDVAAVGRSNVSAFNAWSELQRPAFDSTARKAEHAEIVATVQRLLETKRTEPTRVVDASPLMPLRTIDARLRASVHQYNERVASISAEIERRIEAARATPIDTARSDVRRLDATAARYSPGVAAAVEEKLQLEEAIAQLKLDKDAADARMKARANGKLASFATKVNRLLELLCADFRLEELGTERSGGSPALRFMLRVEAGRFEVASSSGEERLARVLSEGDRSTLAFAIFLHSIGEHGDLSEKTIVFDDPMTSQDAQRSESTAEQITVLAVRAAQVLVLSHSAAFLEQVAYDWRRHESARANELVELELDRGARALIPWSAHEFLQLEHTRRIAELHAFVKSPTSDRIALKMHGEIRKVLEGHMRVTRPDLYEGRNTTLEPILGRLKADDRLRSEVGIDVIEWERVCAFGARGNHDASALRIEPPSAEMIKAMARRALDLVGASAR